MNWKHFITGVSLVAGIVIYGGSNAYLSRAFEEASSIDFRVDFDDAKGLKGGEEVRVAGFQVGSVKQVELSEDGRKAIALLRVKSKVKIPKNSQISVAAGLLGGGSYVTITPGDDTALIQQHTTDQAPLHGMPATGLDSALAGASKLTNDAQLQEDLKATVHNIRITTERLNRLGVAAFDDPKGNLQATLRNLQLASEKLPSAINKVDQVMGNAAKISAQAERLEPLLEKQISSLGQQTKTLLASMDSVIKSGGKVAKEAESLTHEVNTTVVESRSSIKALLRSANDAASGAAGLAEQLAGFAGDKDLRKNIVDATGNLVKITDNFAEISKKLDGTVATLSKTATDPELLGDVKATVGNLKDVTTSVKNLAARVEALRLPGEKRAVSNTPSLPGKSSTKLPSWYEPGLTGDFLYDTKAERFQLDANYALVNKGQLYRVGLFDATERNRVNLQVGQKSGEFWTRYGLFGGKLGVGFDAPVGPLQWRVDLQDPNRFTVNTRVRARLNDTTALTFGVNSVGNGNHPMLGLQIRK